MPVRRHPMAIEAPHKRGSGSAPRTTVPRMGTGTAAGRATAGFKEGVWGRAATKVMTMMTGDDVLCACQSPPAGRRNARIRGRTIPYHPLFNTDTAMDDNAPLVRQIPTALSKARRTIRFGARSATSSIEGCTQCAQHALLTQQQQQPHSRAPLSTINTVFAAPAPPLAATGSSPPKATARPRMKMLPSTMGSPFSVGDFTKKLLGLQGASSAMPASPTPVSPMVPAVEATVTSWTDEHYGCEHLPERIPAGFPAPSARGRGVAQPPPHALFPLRAGDADAMLLILSARCDALDPERTSASELQRRGGGKPPPARRASHFPRHRTPSARRRTIFIRRRTVLDRAHLSTERWSEPEGLSPISHAQAVTLSSQAQPAPAQLPASTFSQPGKACQMMWQQRVFIGNMQHFCQVEIGSGTGAGRARDVNLHGSWNTDKTVNLLVPLLSTKTMPSPSPKGE
ncbi:hypothetical protein VTO73DRAFT_6576 [Trametes versicolor]